MNQAKRTQTGFGWICLAIVLSLPWLIPVHTEPLPTLYSEVAAGLAVVPLALWVLIMARGRLALDVLSLGFALAALIPLMQAMGGLFLFPAEAPVISLYLVGFALTVMVARRTEEDAPGRVPDALFAGLVIAALASTAFALAQWIRLDWGPLLAAIPGGGVRAVANVGQPNMLSSLLVWGLVGLWWFNFHRRIGGGVTLFSAAFLLIGVASTQSRTGWLAIGLLLAAALVVPASLGASRQRAAVLGLGTWFVLLVLVWPMATSLVDAGDARSLNAQLAIGLRPEIWTMMVDGIRHQPWLGYGWNQGQLVQLGELPNYANIKGGVQHAHNLVLDLMVWNGVPLGLGFAALLGAWFWWQLRRITTFSQVLLMLALSTFMLHAMLELPHCKTFFLVPAALMMGTLNARSGLPVVLQVPRLLIALCVAILAWVLVLTWIDYRRIEVDLQAYRMRMAWSGIRPAPPAPTIYILGGLQDALVNLRIEPRAGMDLNELERLRVTTNRYPIESALFKYAKAAASNGKPVDAQESLTRWCLLFPKDRCNVARTAWTEFLAEHPEIGNVPFPITQ
ncbi:O-antigen ligase family protein [Rhodoferax sp.]|uniref:O-antigen ligase family protein n=1 Tax=Rhodoferax sp. TaxID=50421 RepID=UPI0019FDADD9|nr:O-antigen ligase family protein [Rhodoferax sp.]MBE0474930.1 O-antigen ligase C-terminal domain-containing protein [Rhodoferax sp.]